MPDRRLIAFFTAVAVFVADRWSKSIVEHRFDSFDTKVVIPGFFSIVRSSNPGVAFGMLSDNTSHQRTFLLVVVSVVAVLILAIMLWRVQNQDSSTMAGLALIFGGALGNVYDRALTGSVTDFLDFHAGTWHWYVFNLADSAICVGAGLLILSMLLSHRKESTRKASGA